jgi:hypothetical protein
MLSDFFSDGKLGGKRRALSAAIAQRDEWLAVSPAISRIERARQPMRTNTSGIPGVRHRMKTSYRDGRTFCYAVWTASGTPEPGVRRTKDFLVSRYGADDAREKAIAQRRAWELQMQRYDRAQRVAGKRA